MNVCYGDYLNALSIVKAYHRQLENARNLIASKNKITGNGDEQALIVPLLKTCCNVRVQNAVSKVLYDSISKGNIPFDTIDFVTVHFFVRNFKLDDFKYIKNFGSKSFESMKNILKQHGHSFP